MKKLYIKDMEIEERNKLIKFNKKLITKLQNDLYTSNLDMQYIESKNIMNDEALKAIQYHDNYSSFYYTLKNWRKFYQNIDYDYLSDEASKKADKITANIDKINALEYYNDDYIKIDEECEKLAKEILQEIEELLHTYEEYPTEDDAIQYADEMERLSDNVIRLDISYTECYI